MRDAPAAAYATRFAGTLEDLLALASGGGYVAVAGYAERPADPSAIGTGSVLVTQVATNRVSSRSNGWRICGR